MYADVYKMHGMDKFNDVLYTTYVL